MQDYKCILKNSVSIINETKIVIDSLIWFINYCEITTINISMFQSILCLSFSLIWHLSIFKFVSNVTLWFRIKKFFFLAFFYTIIGSCFYSVLNINISSSQRSCSCTSIRWRSGMHETISSKDPSWMLQG